MFIVRALFILSLLHWLYLADILQPSPTKRKYLKLYRDNNFFLINTAIAIAFLFIKGIFIPSGQVSISTAPAVFILLDRLLIKHSIIRYGKPFLFLQKGDTVKGKKADYIYSFILLAGSLGLGLILDYLWTTYY